MIAMLLSLAWANCDSVYSNGDFQTALDEVDRLMGNADIDRAIGVLRETENDLPCMEQLIDVKQYARFSRNYAVINFLQQDAEQALKWGRVLESLPDPDWGDTPEDHPVRNMLRAEEPEEADPPSEEAGFAIHKNGAVFMNGQFVAQPSVRDGIPYLVQVFQQRGYLVSANWQEGAIFPSEFVDDSGPREMPKWYDPETRTITPKGKPPPVPGTQKKRKVPVIPLIAGGALLVGSGAMYALAGVTKTKFTCDPTAGGTDCPSSADLTGLRTQANLLVMGSAITAVAGAGIIATGFVVEDGAPRLVITGRF